MGLGAGMPGRGAGLPGMGIGAALMPNRSRSKAFASSISRRETPTLVFRPFMVVFSDRTMTAAPEGAHARLTRPR
jgi:hypothetical protein